MLAIGLMSGTSLDGIDAALIDTDGEGEVRPIAFHSAPYDDAARTTLAAAAALALQQERPVDLPPIAAAGALLDRLHVEAVRALLAAAGIAAPEVSVIGYHGQTVAHRPDRGWTWQIGDGAALARTTGIVTVSDLRSADVAAGGQGAPLLPVYHAARVAGIEGPVVVLNLGGVANVTFVGAGGELVAFDTGPANGLIDDWILLHTGARFDAGGALAASGRVDESVLTAMPHAKPHEEAHPDLPTPIATPPKPGPSVPWGALIAGGLLVAGGVAAATLFTRRKPSTPVRKPAPKQRRKKATS